MPDELEHRPSATTPPMTAPMAPGRRDGASAARRPRDGASTSARRAGACVLLGVAAAIGASGANAAEAYADGRVYVEAQVGAANIRVGDLQFYPLLGGISAGAYVRPGIALELHAEGGIADDDDGGFELGLDRAAGVGIRFESPPVRRTSGYITLGYAAWTISQELEESAAGNARDVEEDFGGVRVSVGAVSRFERVPALSASAEFRTYYTDDGLRATALLVGLRLSAP